MVPAIIPIPFVQYVKKEDVFSFLTSRRKVVGLVLFAMVNVNVIMALAVFPRLRSMYIDLGIPVPMPITIFPYGITLLGLVYLAISVYLFSTKPDKEKIEELISKYNDGEMISVKQFTEVKLDLLVFFLIGLSVAYLLLSIVAPIYSITSSV
ncbi:hypothetical protein H6802_02920 [Candidatus Nomurabacteria bacterium]|uniref:Uncharacterized protein n=1 Tax=candidate division WWE3 bacterium TaxID=2053526 RepID=A0A955E0U0_UNCKA|nr:hypothetical protein [candidate division WWE3 bacterium]MCB9823886.1 hypothetical protein [Candidatus Nomurabacteria bacterium]MCB9827134.1 hypothetical protein [Candidatus Nomurabacteria bacterium]MCB9827825.1 hypothetical protein [Candidatus Nomurabacteria bacterium]